MPPTTTTKRGSGLSRSEAAILAWKKRTRAAPKVTGGMANPKIRARVAEILAEKANKGKKKAKAKAKPKGKSSADAAKKKAEAAAKKAERAKAAAAKKQEREKAKLVGAMQRTAKQAARTAAQQAKQAERTKVVAEKKKQAEGKQKVMARARKKTKAKKEPKDDDTAERASAALEKWRKIREIQRIGKAIDMEIKAGARHSRTDLQHLQGIHDSSVACGASCGAEGDDTGDDETAEKAIKGIMDNPQWYASHECGDVMQAASALQTLCLLIQSELSEEDEDAADVTQLVDAARTLVTFIGGELDELEGAAGDAANDTRMGPMNKAVTEDAAPHLDGSAVKAMDDDTIGGYAVLFGNADTPDIERDFYTKSTNFWLDDFGWPRPITYHHGMDAATRDNPVIGHWTKAAVDDTGVWLTGQLDKAHAYYKAIKQLAERGYLKLSSDSAPQWVQRERQPNGANFVKRWPLITASTTVTPMEPRMLPVEVKAFLAEIGYEAIESDSQEAIDPDAVEADGRQAADDERARALSMELDLIELETIE